MATSPSPRRCRWPSRQERAARRGRAPGGGAAKAAGGAALGQRVGDRGPGLHQPAPGAAAKQAVVAEVLAAGARYGAAAGQRPARDGRVRLGQPDRPAASGPCAPGGARRRAVQPVRDAGLAGHARVLLQRRRRADRHAGGLGEGAHRWREARRRGGGPRRPTRASTSPTSPPTSWRRRRSKPTTAIHRVGRSRTISTASASSPWPICATSRTSTCRPSACKFDNYFLESGPVHERQGRSHRGAPDASGQTYEADGALWLKTTATATTRTA